MICKKCGKEIPLQHQYLPPDAEPSTDNGLLLIFDGGYGEFIDAPFVPKAEWQVQLCHECAHDLCDWLGVDPRNWHTHAAGSGQHADHHDQQ